MRILTLNLVNHSIVNIALGGSAVITFAGLPVSKESRARSVVVIFTPDGRIAYEALETVDQIAVMLTEPAQSSPTDADIDRRVQLLREAARVSVDRGPAMADWSAQVDGRFYVVDYEGDHLAWKEVSESDYAAALRRIAIRMLIRKEQIGHGERA